MTQDEAFAILKTGANVFLTGEPGAGKTHTINRYVRFLRECGIEPAITASTGIAATHIGGLTIHSWSGIGIKDKLTREDMRHIRETPHYAKRIRRAKVLIIDEVSMLDGRIFALLDRVCRDVRDSIDPFGGLQVVCVGDFFQLPPVSKRPADRDDSLFAGDEDFAGPLFAFQSDTWETLGFTVCYLTEQYRQDDADFLSVLSAIRRGAVTDVHIRHIEKRKGTHEEALRQGVTKLFSHNMDVDRVNDVALAGLPEKAIAFAMAERGPKAIVETLRKGCLSPELLKLKKGAAVMFTKNSQQGKYMNGTLGTVVAFDGETHFPVVRTREGILVDVEPAEWVVEEEGSTRAKITQLPLRLAWAMTIHKSQGMSLDAAVIDLSRVFEYGQGYVALSRVRRLSGLYLLGYNRQSLLVHPEVLEADRAFRAQSERARAAYGKISPEEREKQEDTFIRECEGKKPSDGKQPKKTKRSAAEKGTPKSLDDIRAKFPNAYRPWNEEDDKKLRMLFAGGMPIARIAKHFERKPGSIRSRLKKFGLIEE
jgi:ATP-dependent exoDNAse (exonuclease V) alpha subunit